MRSNPFAPHAPAPPEVFVNREREIDLILGHVRSVQRGNVAIHGPLGIGKTSLLRHVTAPEVAAAQGLLPPAYALVYLDVHSVTPFSADRFWRRAVQLTLRLPGADLRAPAEQLLARPALDIIDLEEFLDALADRSMALVLLLDEFEWALSAETSEEESESRNFLAQMASLARRAPRVLSLVVATEAPLFEATRVIESWRGSPFATVFTALPLRPLSQTDADALFDRALYQTGVDFSAEDRRRLYSLSGGQPGALQAAAFNLYHGLQQAEPRSEVWAAAESAALEALDSSPLASNGSAARAARERQPSSAPSAAGEGLTIDLQSGEVRRDGQRLDSLTALEYSLLRLLYANPGRLCSKEDIIRQVWGEEFMGEDDDSRVEKLVSRLRRKVEPVPGRPQFIRTVRGRGYRYVPG